MSCPPALPPSRSSANEYPFGADQVWAEPDVAHAAELLIRLIDAHAKSVCERARRHMRENFSDAALGARYRARFEAIAAEGTSRRRTR